MRAQILILAAILALPILADSTPAVRPNQLQGITNSQVTGNDLFLLFDSSAGVTKKFPASELDIRYAGALTAITRLTGEVTTTGSGATAATVANSAVMGKLLTGFSPSAGVVATTDTVLQAFDKIVGNIALLAAKNAPTFTGTVTLQDGAITVPTGTNLTLSVDAVVAPIYKTTSGNGFFGNNGSNGCVGYVGAGCVWQWGTSDMGPMSGKRVLPYTDNASDLGGSSNRWKDLYLAGNATFLNLDGEPSCRYRRLEEPHEPKLFGVYIELVCFRRRLRSWRGQGISPRDFARRRLEVLSWGRWMDRGR
jgi:hypothetical protein